jgi:transcriptional regulator with XRE-family HTH domain
MQVISIRLLPDAVRTRRAALGISQTELSNRIGNCPGTVGLVERRNIATPWVLERLAIALGCDVSELRAPIEVDPRQVPMFDVHSASAGAVVVKKGVKIHKRSGAAK